MRAVFFDAGFFGLEQSFGHQWLNVVIDLNRKFSLAQLQNAAAALCETFPILKCRYVPGFLFDHWLPVEKFSASAIISLAETVSIEDATAEFIHEPMDAESGPPWRARLLTSGESSRLILKMLHLAADGAGALTVTRELGNFLFGLKQASGPLPNNRGMWQVLRAVRLKDVPALLLESLGEFLRPAIIPLIPPEELPAVTPGMELREQYHPVVIAGADYLRLKDRCRRLNCTVNDAVLAAMAELSKNTTGRRIICLLFTADLRKYLPSKDPVVGNLSGGNILTLRRTSLGGFEKTARLVAGKTGEIKSRIPGLQLILFQLFTYGLLPHGIVRRGATFLARYFNQVMRRATLMTNIGPMDEYLEPYGEAVRSACVIGPCIKRLVTPVFVVTGFRDSITIQACSWNDLPLEKVRNLCESLRRELIGP